MNLNENYEQRTTEANCVTAVRGRFKTRQADLNMLIAIRQRNL